MPLFQEPVHQFATITRLVVKVILNTRQIPQQLFDLARQIQWEWLNEYYSIYQPGHLIAYH